MAQEVRNLRSLEEAAFRKAVETVAPSVLRIETFGGLERVGRLLVGTGPTTGLVVSEDGYVISSAFNFIQQPSSILVTLPGGRRVSAEIVARDHSRMLVLLKLNASDKLVVSEVAPKAEMTVGQWTIAIGKTFDPKVPNMSVGVSSALDRIWGKAVQTDAKISPSNYGGPLIDIRGRVIGVLVPLSPQSQSEIAGAEWYESGIGFAIPLADIMPKLQQMKQGEDLYAGILGISLKGNELYSKPVVIAACQPNSPAYDAGLRKDDKIIEAEGTPIERQAQLKHILGPKYAGDEVHIVALRGDQRIEATVELAAKLEPYEHPFLGILPQRAESDDAGGVVVRFVYPASPAAESDIRVGDRILKLGEEPIPDAGTMQEMIATHDTDQKAKLTIRRGDQQSLTVELELATLPAEIPNELPPAHDDIDPAEERPPVGRIEIKLPEESNECLAYIPETYHPDLPHGLIISLHTAGGYEEKELINRWKSACEENDLILLAPKSADPSKWLPTEVAFIRKTMDEIVEKYNIDRTRIVASGYQAGGAIAYLVALSNIDLIRGIAAIDAPLPQRALVPPNDPIHRLAIYSALPTESKLADRIKAGTKQLSDAKFPVSVREIDGKSRDLNDKEFAELIRWIDTLDRI